MLILETQEQLRGTNHRTPGLHFRCSVCGEAKPVPQGEWGCGTGYGYDKDNRPVCYACCGEQDRADMIKTGKAVLYLSSDSVSNWPGTLKFKPHYRTTGRHNMARRRYDVWFTGPDGKNWHGVQYGDNTQICHCRRVKV